MSILSALNFHYVTHKYYESWAFQTYHILKFLFCLYLLYLWRSIQVLDGYYYMALCVVAHQMGDSFFHVIYRWQYPKEYLMYSAVRYAYIPLLLVNVRSALKQYIKYLKVYLKWNTVFWIYPVLILYKYGVQESFDTWRPYQVVFIYEVLFIHFKIQQIYIIYNAFRLNVLHMIDLLSDVFPQIPENMASASQTQASNLEPLMASGVTFLRSQVAPQGSMQDVVIRQFARPILRNFRPNIVTRVFQRVLDPEPAQVLQPQPQALPPVMNVLEPNNVQEPNVQQTLVSEIVQRLHPNVEIEDVDDDDESDIDELSISSQESRQSSSSSSFGSQESEKDEIRDSKENHEESAINEMYNETCTICLTDFQRGENVSLFDCGHAFHKACAKEHIYQTEQQGRSTLKCPNCRHVVDCRS